MPTAILVEGTASETQLRRNLVTDNGDDGLDVEDPTAKIIGNTAWENGDYGIEAVPGVEGGGNRALANGNPEQCLEINCKAPVAAGLNPSDIVVADQGLKAIFRVDPSNGDQTILSLGGLLTTPRGLAIDANGRILVAVKNSLINGIARVDPTIPDGSPGNQTIVSSGGNFIFPADLLIEPNGDVLVADAYAGVIRVDPDTGAQTVVSSGGSFTAISGIAIDANGDILVSDFDTLLGPGEVIRVDPVTGTQAVVSSGGNFLNPVGIAMDASGDILVANQGPYPYPYSDEGGPHSIVRVDPATGAQTVVFLSSEVLPAALAIDGKGDILVADSFNGVIKVDPATGFQTLVSSGVFFTPVGIERVSAPQRMPGGDGGDLRGARRDRRP